MKRYRENSETILTLSKLFLGRKSSAANKLCCGTVTVRSECNKAYNKIVFPRLLNCYGVTLKEICTKCWASKTNVLITSDFEKCNFLLCDNQENGLMSSDENIVFRSEHHVSKPVIGCLCVNHVWLQKIQL